jgi:cellulose 1,4-beta-cellobiosidase
MTGGGTTTGGTGTGTTSIACTNKLSGSQTVSLDGGAYKLQSNEFDSSAALSICNNAGLDFDVASSSIAQTSTVPGAYPSLFKGCHFGDCTTGSGMPISVSTITGTAGTVTTSYNTTTVTGGKWDDSYDIWYNAAKTTSNNETGLEMMIWLNHTTGNEAVQPIGSVVASNVSIGGHVYNVWHGVNGGTAGTVSYVLATPDDSLSNIDLGPLAADAVSRGYLSKADFLIDVEAGFEVWNNGAGLTANSFSVNVK